MLIPLKFNFRSEKSETELFEEAQIYIAYGRKDDAITKLKELEEKHPESAKIAELRHQMYSE